MAPTTTPSRGDTGCESVAAITVTDKLPQFWTDSPRLWFAQFEAIIAPQKQGEDYKYNMVISKLPKEVVHQVSDILTNPPSENKYSTIKERLINCYEESEHRRFHRLLSEMDLGDQKPSQLLRKMKEAGCGKINDDTIRLLWLRQLPASLTAILSVTNNISLENLSELADKIYENLTYNKKNTQETAVDINLVTNISSQLEAMRIEINALRSIRENQPMQRSKYQTRHAPHFRSRSRHRNSHNGLCYFHNRFKQDAYKCNKPCSWNIIKNNRLSEN